MESSLDGDMYAFSEMVDHVALFIEFSTPFADWSPGMVGLGHCGSLFTGLRKRRAVAGEYLVRHGSGIQLLWGNWGAG